MVSGFSGGIRDGWLALVLIKQEANWIGGGRYDSRFFSGGIGTGLAVGHPVRPYGGGVVSFLVGTLSDSGVDAGPVGD